MTDENNERKEKLEVDCKKCGFIQSDHNEELGCDCKIKTVSGIFEFMIKVRELENGKS